MTNLFIKPEWTTQVGDGPDGWQTTWKNGLGIAPLPGVEWKAPRVEVAEGVVHFKLENGALWADITQQVSVVAGAVYHLSVEAEPQLRHEGNPANDPLSGEIAVIAGNLAWRGTDAFPNNVWTPLAVDVTAVGTGLTRLGWSVRLRHQLDQNWYHLRLPKLEVVSLPATPDGTAPSTNPPPPPPPGDGGEPTDEFAVLTGLATSFDLDTNLLVSVLGRMKKTRDAMLTEMVRLRNLPG